MSCSFSVPLGHVSRLGVSFPDVCHRQVAPEVSVGPDECDVQMLLGGSSVTDILLADSACKRDVEQWGQERGSLSQAAPSFPQRRFPRDSVRSDPLPISHSTLDLSFFQLCTYTCGYYFVLLSLPRYCELLVDKECPPGHSMSHSNSLPLG